MTNLLRRSLAVAALITTSLAAHATTVPHLEKRGETTQLIVDGKPWLILGGEMANTASSDLAYMDTVWPQMTRLNLNTVIVGMGWGWVEPEEGKFDFSLVDGLLDGARKNHQHVIFIWFGSWKTASRASLRAGSNAIARASHACASMAGCRLKFCPRFRKKRLRPTRMPTRNSWIISRMSTPTSAPY